jgi:hypothetical protein
MGVDGTGSESCPVAGFGISECTDRVSNPEIETMKSIHYMFSWTISVVAILLQNEEQDVDPHFSVVRYMYLTFKNAILHPVSIFYFIHVAFFFCFNDVMATRAKL